MTTWLLTGGAGYIGAHVARALRASGRDVVVLDDLSSGHPDRLPPDVRFVRASVLDTDAVTRALREHRVEGVVHLAGKKSVAESVSHPSLYVEHNVVGVARLLRAMARAGVGSLVFSSSAAVYGATGDAPVVESGPVVPANPYGWSKLAGEELIRLAGETTGLRWVSLRYFNVAGAALPELADRSVSNLIPMTFEAIAAGRRPAILGSDYPTPDGTCVRDYIHVADLAEAHTTAAARLESGGRGAGAVYNIGTGRGTSVREVVEMVLAVTGSALEPEYRARREGDSPFSTASVAAAAEGLGWHATRDLTAMVTDAYAGWTAVLTGAGG